MGDDYISIIKLIACVGLKDVVDSISCAWCGNKQIICALSPVRIKHARPLWPGQDCSVCSAACSILLQFNSQSWLMDYVCNECNSGDKLATHTCSQHSADWLQWFRWKLGLLWCSAIGVPWFRCTDSAAIAMGAMETPQLQMESQMFL
jgi:hypothetical protein